MEKKKKVIVPIVTASVSTVVVGSLVLTAVGIFLGIFLTQRNKNEEIYQKANEHLYRYEFEESETLFKSIYKYKDSAAKIGVIHGMETLNETGNYNKAIEATVETGGVIEVAFTTDGTPVDPLTITEKTVIDAKSYIDHYDFLKWNILSYYLIENSHKFQLNLYSSFAPHVYSITYDVGEGFVVDPVRSYTYGTSVTATNAYRDGYTFAGYSIGDAEEIYNPFVIKETDGQNFFLKAHYTPNEYTYEFDPNGGTTPVDRGTYTYNHQYLLPTAHKDGYDFVGWYTDYGKKLEPTINIDENTTLYAHYTPTRYHINYDLRGGKFLESAPEGYNTESADITIPYPHRDGYLFVGWVKEDQTYKNAEVNYVIPMGSIGDITLHACYREYASDFGNSYIKALGDFDIADEYPFDVSEFIPGYVMPYNINEFEGNIFSNELIDSFGVEKMNSCFAVAGSHNEYLLNKDLTSVFKMAFTSFDELRDITLPESVTTIEEYAFAHAPVRSVVSENVTHIKEGAFASSHIEEFELPNVVTFENKAFDACVNLTSIHDSLLNAEYIGDRAFYNTQLTSVVVGDSVTYLGPLSFGGSELHHHLTSFECLSTEFETMNAVLTGQTGTISLRLAKVVDSIKDIFGGGAVHLDVLDLVGVEDIPDEFLYGIDDFTSLNDTVDIVTIGDRAFYGTTKHLIPSLTKVTHIGESAFETCSDLGEVVLKDIEYIGDHAFKDSGLTSINIPESVTYIGDGAFERCEDLEKIILSSPDQLEELNLVGNMNRLFSENTFAFKLDIEVRGEGTLPMRAFQNLYVGRSVTLGEEVNLSEFAFNNATSIQAVNFNHERNTIIPKGCFENASSLKTIDITNIAVIYSFAFNNCVSLETIIDQNGENNTLGNSLHTVHNQAFGNLMMIDCLAIKNPNIEYGEAIFANDTFEIDLYNGSALSNEALRDFLGATMIMP